MPIKKTKQKIISFFININLNFEFFYNNIISLHFIKIQMKLKFLFYFLIFLNIKNYLLQ